MIADNHRQPPVVPETGRQRPGGPAFPGAALVLCRGHAEGPEGLAEGLGGDGSQEFPADEALRRPPREPNLPRGGGLYLTRVARKRVTTLERC